MKYRSLFWCLNGTFLVAFGATYLANEHEPVWLALALMGFGAMSLSFACNNNGEN